MPEIHEGLTVELPFEPNEEAVQVTPMLIVLTSFGRCWLVNLRTNTASMIGEAQRPPDAELH